MESDEKNSIDGGLSSKSYSLINEHIKLLSSNPALYTFEPNPRWKFESPDR